ncbi:secondary thiamine-phosphate synthase enzyme YjbQ [soil metagenome]
MTTHHTELAVGTGAAEETRDITAEVSEAVRSSAVRDGICLIAVAHTTAGLFVNENADPDVQRDLLGALRRIVPDRADYRHAEGNSPAHIKAVLTGNEVALPVRSGALVLGRWQGIFFAEFDGPRTRTVSVTVVGDPA